MTRGVIQVALGGLIARFHRAEEHQQARGGWKGIHPVMRRLGIKEQTVTWRKDGILVGDMAGDFAFEAMDEFPPGMCDFQLA